MENIGYGLARELREAGFPQHMDMVTSGDDVASVLRRMTHSGAGFHAVWDYSHECDEEPNPDNGKPRASVYLKREYLESEKGKGLTVYKPSLSELIGAIVSKLADDDRSQLRLEYWHPNEKWEAMVDFQESETGKTPEEAVARLWLAINKK